MNKSLRLFAAGLVSLAKKEESSKSSFLLYEPRKPESKEESK
ncbi:hypothetical protein [Bacillus solimangrovi]|nr:hypothetical protein [Bacillus solimangrovi]